MKTIAVAMLFGLCSLIGIRIAAGKTERLQTVRTLHRELRQFAEHITGGQGTLRNAAEGSDLLNGMLSVYLKALEAGGTESSAAAQAAAALTKNSTEQAGAEAFFTDLSVASRTDLGRRIERFSQLLERAETESDAGSRQARVIRVSGVLIGAALAILLL